MSARAQISQLADADWGAPAAQRRVSTTPDMAVRQLQLTDFRSYETLHLQLSGAPVVLAGANGVGKTNVLEALSMLAPGRGLRGAKVSELTRHGASGGWAVSAALGADQGQRRLGVGTLPGVEEDRRVARLDGAAAPGLSALGDCVRVLWVAPQMDRLFTDGASERRRFLDRLTFARDPAHSASAGAYTRVMRERQSALMNGVRDEAWLEALELQMAEAGVALAAARVETVRALAPLARAADVSGFPSAEIAVGGLLEDALADARPASDIEDGYARRLADLRTRDREAGRATEGPHRSDLMVRKADTGAPARECSTGEQKALLMRLILANAEFVSQECAPALLVLLLDEVGAHFDPERRAALFERCANAPWHVWMTGAEASLFSALKGRAQAFHIECGGAREFEL